MFKKINGKCWMLVTGCPAFSGISAALQLALVAGVAPVALVEERLGYPEKPSEYQMNRKPAICLTDPSLAMIACNFYVSFSHRD